MKLEDKKIGFCITGSFCTFKVILEQLKNIKKEKAKIIPIMSKHSYTLDSRFGSAKDFIDKVESITEHKIIQTIQEAEAIGPKKMVDIMIIAPCTGNTIAKLRHGITDTTVTMAAKSHLRNNNSIVIAVSTNDGLSRKCREYWGIIK